MSNSNKCSKIQSKVKFDLCVRNWTVYIYLLKPSSFELTWLPSPLKPSVSMPRRRQVASNRRFLIFLSSLSIYIRVQCGMSSAMAKVGSANWAVLML